MHRCCCYFCFVLFVVVVFLCVFFFVCFFVLFCFFLFFCCCFLLLLLLLFFFLSFFFLFCFVVLRLILINTRPCRPIQEATISATFSSNTSGCKTPNYIFSIQSYARMPIYFNKSEDILSITLNQLAMSMRQRSFDTLNIHVLMLSENIN